MTIYVQALIGLLQSLKQQGLGPREAVRAALASTPGAMEFTLPHGGTMVATAVCEVFSPITPAELAIILHEAYPSQTALDIGRTILTPDVLPCTPASEMAIALMGAGFSATDTSDAVNILYPITMTVQANKAWQASGLIVTGRQVTQVTAQGSWTANPDFGMWGPAGSPRFLAKQGYPLPGQAEGALIGRIGNSPPFLVGRAALAPAGRSGSFELCINDDLNSQYGRGLRNNRGMLTVLLQTLAR